MKIISTFFSIIFFALMLGVAGLFLAPLMPFEHNLELRIVESGSMEPSIKTGSLVLILPHEEYTKGDVITFKSSSSDVPTTHRIADTYVENGRTWFVTKGDANEEEDTQAVRESDVLGSVRLSVPYAGFVLDFARQPVGFAFLIVLPALALIFGEIEKIWIELRRRKTGSTLTHDKEKKTPLVVSEKTTVAQTNTSRPMMDISTPVRYRIMQTLDLRNMAPYRYEAAPAGMNQRRGQLLAVLAVILFGSAVVGMNLLGSTVSYFNDSEFSVDNILHAISLDFSVLPDGEIYSFADGVLLGDDDNALVTIVSPEPGSVDVRYDVAVEVTGGNSLFCDAINGATDEPFIYDGPLTALSADDVTFDAPWVLSLSLPDDTGFSNGEMCLVDVVYTAWYFDELLDQGYFDEERVPLSFTLVGVEELNTAAAASFSSVPLEDAEVIIDAEDKEPEVVIEEKVEDESESSEVETVEEIVESPVEEENNEEEVIEEEEEVAIEPEEEQTEVAEEEETEPEIEEESNGNEA